MAQRHPTSRAVWLAALLVALAGAVAPAAAGEVRVVARAADRFADIGIARSERERTLAALESHLVDWGRRHLKGDQSLTIEWLDIDLSGTAQPTARGELRTLRGGADAPRLHLRYALQARGATLAQGEERLTDLGYLERLPAVPADEPLRHEKRLLDRWLESRIVPLLGAPQ